MAMRWLPLECNPDVMNKFLGNLGLSSEWSIVDVYGFDDEMLGIVPQPTAALVFLFPVSLADSKEPGDPALVEKSYFMTQTIRNACGTMALLHAIANNQDKLTFTEDSLLKAFLDKTASMTPDERAQVLESDMAIGTTHESSAQEGQTEAPPLADDIDYHFVAFVERNGRLLQMDGRKAGPIDHGPTSQDTLLFDAARISREFIARSPPDCVGFSAVALCRQ